MIRLVAFKRNAAGSNVLQIQLSNPFISTFHRYRARRPRVSRSGSGVLLAARESVKRSGETCCLSRGSSCKVRLRYCARVAMRVLWIETSAINVSLERILGQITTLLTFDLMFVAEEGGEEEEGEAGRRQEEEASLDNASTVW